MDRRPFTVIVRCADPRLEPFFADPMPRASMGLPERAEPLTEAYISNVGGLLSLAGAEVPRLVHDAGLLLELFGDGGGRVVLTAHSVCGGYQDAVRGDAGLVRARQEDDLRTTALRLRNELGDIAVDCYYLDTDQRTVEAVTS